MKNLWAPVLLIVLFVFFGCKNETLVGKWKLTRTYMKNQGKRTGADSKDDFIEFQANRDMLVRIFGETPNVGTYATDTTVTPHRIVNTSKDGKTKYSQIYKIEDKKLIIIIPVDPKDGFANDSASIRNTRFSSTSGNNTSKRSIIFRDEFKLPTDFFDADR